MMLDQLFESFRKTSECSMHMQEEMYKQWAQQWPTLPLNAAGVSAEWVQTFQKRWIEFMTDSLNKHRESLDSMYKSSIQVIERASHLSEAKSPDDFRRMVEDLGGRCSRFPRISPRRNFASSRREWRNGLKCCRRPRSR